MLIFLDIDGVMTPLTGWKLPENLEDGFPMFSKRAVSALQDLLAGYADVKVILSTSHRDRFSLDEWKAIFKLRGLTIKNIDRLPSNTGLNKKRIEEIEEWFRMNVVNEDFLIIDDDKGLNALPLRLKHHLVSTRSAVGLTREDLTVFA